MEDTIRQEFEYRYFTIKNERGAVSAIQPFFILDQDLIAGVGPRIGALINSIRRVWPRFLKMRTLMVGCTAGEGHLDGAELLLSSNARLLASDIVAHARSLHAPLIVLKEFPAKYREPLKCFLDHGFSGVPSLPMTRLNIDYLSFDEYMNRALNSATRRKLRKKFKAAEQGPPIEMSVIDDTGLGRTGLRSRAACVYETPRSLISRTASSLNSRVNFRLSMTHLRFHKNT